jgi:hypothetical protein
VEALARHVVLHRCVADEAEYIEMRKSRRRKK